MGLACLVATTAACGGDDSTGASTTTTVAGPPTSKADRLLASDGTAGDNLGGAVWYNTFQKPIEPVYYATAGESAMSSDGKLAIVGAPGAANGTKVGAGQAYVWTDRGGKWSETAKLVATDAAAYDAFGWTVAVSGDGKTAVVGAAYADAPQQEDAGAAYVFRQSAGRWQQIAKVSPKDLDAYDGFGTAVGMSRDGTTAIVGAPGAQVGTVEGAGAAYVLREVNGTWTPVKRLVADRPSTFAEFGSFVALSANGSIGAVTKRTHIDKDKVYRAGGAYVFTTIDSWVSADQSAAFDDSNHNSDNSFDAYGVHVALSDDGLVMAVAAPDVNVGKALGAGATYVYTTTGDWTTAAENRTTTLYPPAPVTYAYYGSSVALSSDGKILWIGADGAGGNAQGEGYLVRPRTEGAGDRWAPQSYVQAQVPAPHAENGRFGTAVSMSADGQVLLGTSPWLDIDGKDKQGAAFVIRVPEAADDRT